MINFKKFISYLLVIIILLWTIIAIGRISINIAKIITEDISWISLSSNQKQQLLYGDNVYLYTQLKYITNPRDKILLLSNDGKSFFLGRYFLYPERIYWIQDATRLNTQAKNYKYLLVYHPKSFPTIQNISYKKVIVIKNKEIEIAKLYIL